MRINDLFSEDDLRSIREATTAAESRTGAAVAATGDLDGDGIMDFIAGAPGLEVDGSAEVGAAAVYLGSTLHAERIRPDIFFVG